MFVAGCTSCQNTPQDFLNIKLSSLPLVKQQKLFWSYTFLLEIARKTFISFWVHWLSEHAPKFPKIC